MQPAILDQPIESFQRPIRARKVSGLKWVESGSDPWPKRRLRGTKAQGITYQKKVSHKIEKMAPQAEHFRGPWFSFEDRNGTGMCSPDHVAVFPQGRMLVVESKLTYTPEADFQLAHLYGPIISEFYELQEPPILLVAFRNFPRGVEIPGVIRNPMEIFMRAGSINYWHFLK